MPKLTGSVRNIIIGTYARREERNEERNVGTDRVAAFGVCVIMQERGIASLSRADLEEGKASSCHERIIMG